MKGRGFFLLSLFFSFTIALPSLSPSLLISRGTGVWELKENCTRSFSSSYKRFWWRSIIGTQYQKQKQDSAFYIVSVHGFTSIAFIFLQMSSPLLHYTVAKKYIWKLSNSVSSAENKALLSVLNQLTLDSWHLLRLSLQNTVISWQIVMQQIKTSEMLQTDMFSQFCTYSSLFLN